mmetsp:Transcript_63224/g.149837  ORF Transcript_63224/g.149837 Transcript_63224/m.149837 type:complete len:334 (+) Transcript_63224:46-1047(+)
MDEGDDELAAALAASMATFEQEEQLQQAPPVRGSLHEFVHTCGASTWKSCPEEPSACSEQCPNVQPETWRHVPHACPFTASTPRSICIRRTIGRLSVSGVDGLLHVGVSDSKGIPLHFDEKGVRTDGVWGDSLVVPLSSDLSDEEWDQALSGHRATWRGRKYHATDTNCYDFVVSFFNTIRLQGRTNHDKFGVVESMIQAPVSAATAFFKMRKRLDSASSFATVPGLECTTCHSLVNNETAADAFFRCSTCTQIACRGCEPAASSAPCSAAQHVFVRLTPSTQHMCDVCSEQLEGGNHVRCVQCADVDFCRRCHQLTAAYVDGHVDTHSTFFL